MVKGASIANDPNPLICAICGGAVACKNCGRAITRVLEGFEARARELPRYQLFREIEPNERGERLFLQEAAVTLADLEALFQNKPAGS